MRSVAVVYDGRDHAVDVFLTVLQQHRSSTHDALLYGNDDVRVRPVQRGFNDHDNKYKI